MYKLTLSEDFKQVLHKARSYKLPKGQIIQSTQDRRVFNFIRAGYVKRYLISNDGSLGVQVIYGPGDFFPITLAFSIIFGQTINSSPETYYYEAITPVELCTVNESVFGEAIEQNPKLYKDLLAISGKRLHSTLHGLENLTLSTSYLRVAHELLYLAKNFGEIKGKTARIIPPLTHQDIADRLSLTRETVSTCIAQLRAKQLISTNKAIVIKDIKQLEAETFS